MFTFIDNNNIMSHKDNTLYNLNKITSLLSCKTFFEKYSANHSSIQGLLFKCYFCKYPCLKIKQFGVNNPTECYSCNKCNEIICNNCISSLQSIMNPDIDTNNLIQNSSFHTNQEKYEEYIISLETSNNTAKNIKKVFSNIIKSNKKLEYNKYELSKLIATEQYAIGKYCPQLYETFEIKECNWCKLYKPFITDINNLNKDYSSIIILHGSICYKCENKEKLNEVFICHECATIVNKMRTKYYPKQTENTGLDSSYSICKNCFNSHKNYNINLEKEIEGMKNKYIIQSISKISDLLEIK